MSQARSRPEINVHSAIAFPRSTYRHVWVRSETVKKGDIYGGKKVITSMLNDIFIQIIIADFYKKGNIKS